LTPKGAYYTAPHRTEKKLSFAKSTWGTPPAREWPRWTTSSSIGDQAFTYANLVMPQVHMTAATISSYASIHQQWKEDDRRIERTPWIAIPPTSNGSGSTPLRMHGVISCAMENVEFLHVFSATKFVFKASSDKKARLTSKPELRSRATTCGLV